MNAKNMTIGIPLAIVFFIFAIITLPAMKDVAQDATTTMNCTDTSLPTGERMSCIGITWYPFIGFMLAAFGGLAYAFKDDGGR